MATKTTIMLADDHKIVRDGLAALLNAEADMKVVAECADGQEALAQAAKLQPQILILDIALPGMDGFEVCRLFASRHPAIKVIALSVHNDHLYIARMMKAGAKGYLSKDCAFDELVKAVRLVAGGGVYLSQKIVGRLVRQAAGNTPPDETALALLTAREREVLKLIAEGMSTKEIAFTLKLSVKTIETFRQKLMDKLHLRSIAALTKFAVLQGLTSLDVPQEQA